MTFIELVIKYNLEYALWAIVEYHTDSFSWLAKIAMGRMNSISQRKYGENVFAESKGR